MRALIVDDNVEKIRVVSQIFANTDGFNMSNLDTASNSVDARRMLTSVHYDLMILDLALPDRIDTMPSPHGGIDLLKEILSRPQYKKPGHIIGLSAYEDRILDAEPIFEQDLWHVLWYDGSSNEWRDQLKRKLRYLMVSKADPDKVAYRTDAAIVCAIHEKELEPLLKFPWGWEPQAIADDPSLNIWRGNFPNGGESKSVVAVAAPRMGLVAAAIAATKIQERFRPRYLLMPGITAGFQGQCNLGDVLVGDPCWNYESGKWAVGASGDVFEPAPHQYPLSSSIRARLHRIAQDESFLNEVRTTWQGAKPDTAIKIRLGPLASGAAVRADSGAKKFVREQHRQAIGLEMEAYAVMAAAAEGTLPEARAVVIKGVCDFADGEKHDAFQAYAAYASARVVKRLLEDDLSFSM